MIKKLDKSAPDFVDKLRSVIRDFEEHIYDGGRPIDVFCDEPEGSPLHSAYVLGISPSTIEYHLGSLDVDGPRFLAWIACQFAYNRG